MTSIKELVSSISEKTGMKKKDITTMYNAFIDTITEEANKDEETKVSIPGLGTLKISVRKAYTAKNPRTGESVSVPASRKAYLKIAPKFVKKINE